MIIWNLMINLTIKYLYILQDQIYNKNHIILQLEFLIIIKINFIILIQQGASHLIHSLKFIKKSIIISMKIQMNMLNLNLI